MAIGIHASGGIGLTISTRGLRSSLNVLDHPIKMPRGTAIKIAIEKPQKTRYKLSSTCARSL
jgi:hypothetical protein